jgi:DedD protein
MMYDDDRDYQPAPHTEIMLSNSKLLLLFLGAAVVCGGCFGFGYTLGKHTAEAGTGVPHETPVAAAGQPGGSDAAVTTTVAKPSAMNSSYAVPTTSPAPAPAATVAAPAAKAAPRATAPATPEPPPAPSRVLPVAAEAAEPAAGAGRTFAVQVAAVSHRGDAEILVSALQRKGYQVNAVQGAQDNLIHVQIGPFANQKDALAMRDRLSNDGYLAIVK